MRNKIKLKKRILGMLLFPFVTIFLIMGIPILLMSGDLKEYLEGYFASIKIVFFIWK